MASPSSGSFNAAKSLADTLAQKITPGDADHSPWPFRVHAKTGEVASQVFGEYTASWTGTLRLFDEMIRLERGDVAACQRARQILSAWLKAYPMKSNKWGPFFAIPTAIKRSRSGDIAITAKAGR